MMPDISKLQSQIAKRPDGRWQLTVQIKGAPKLIVGDTRQQVSDKLRALLGDDPGADRLRDRSDRSIGDPTGY